MRWDDGPARLGDALQAGHAAACANVQNREQHLALVSTDDDDSVENAGASTARWTLLFVTIVVLLGVGTIALMVRIAWQAVRLLAGVTT